MSDRVNKAINNALDASIQIEGACATLRLASLTEVLDQSLFVDISISGLGEIIFDPIDAKAFANRLMDRYAITFIRERDSSGLYQWVSEFNLTGIIIMANEDMDYTGTIVELNQKQA